MWEEEERHSHLQDEHVQSIQPPWEAQEEDAHPSSDQFNLVSVSESQGWEEQPFHLGKIVQGSLQQRETETCTSSLYHRDLYFLGGSCSMTMLLCSGMQVCTLYSAHAAKSSSQLPWLKACSSVCCNLTPDSL